MARQGLFLAGAALAATAAAVVLRTRQAKRQNPPIGRFLTVDGVKLHYVERGSGEPIVFLHGNGSMIADFVTSDLVRLVAQTHRVIVFDRPGYGHSKRPRRRMWSPAAQADLLAKAMTQLGVEKAHLLGHSWGTLIALEWALRHPQTVHSLTLVSGYYFPTPRLDVVLASGPAVPVLGDAMRYTITPLLARLIWPLLLRKLFGPAPTPQHFKDVPRAFILAPLSLRASAEESAMMVPAAAALKDRYAALKVAPLIVTGDGDRIVDFTRQSKRLHELLPDSRLVVIEGAGHMVHHTEPRSVSEAVKQTAKTPKLH